MTINARQTTREVSVKTTTERCTSTTKRRTLTAVRHKTTTNRLETTTESDHLLVKGVLLLYAGGVWEFFSVISFHITTFKVVYLAYIYTLQEQYH